MNFLPIVARELSVQARRRSTYWIRTAACLVGGFLTFWLLVVTDVALPIQSQGQALFLGLSVLAFVYCLLAGPLTTADCLSAEKREGTLGLVFLTDLKGFDIVLGKLLSSSLHAVYGLFAVVPMMSLALLFGGVTAGEIARTALVLANTLFFSLAAGVLVSTLSRNERKAVFGAVLLILLVTAGPYELAYYNFVVGQGPNLDEAILSPSPAFAFTLAKVSLTNSPAAAFASAAAFYQSLAQTHVLAWMLLALASVIVPHVWKDRPKGKRADRWSESWRRWQFGNPAQRAALRRQLLERQPCLWLCSRERFKGVSAWVLVIPLAAIGVWIHFKYRLMSYESSFLLAAVVHVLLKIWLAGETCHRWAEDRRTGALELLLCTPLRVEEMIRGQSMALRRQFAWPATATVVLTFVAWMGLRGQPYTQVGRAWLLAFMPVLIADLVALRWVGMWLGLTAPGLNRAIFQTIARVLCLRWVVYGLIGGSVSVWTWAGSAPVTLLSGPSCWIVVALLLDVVLAWSARKNFLGHFRTIAASPSDYRAAIPATPVRPLVSVGPTQEPPEPPPPTSGLKEWVWHPKRRRLVMATAGLVLALSSFFIYRYSLNWRIERRLAAMQRAGFPMSIQELDQRRPPFTNAVNAAEVLEKAFPNAGMLQSIQTTLRVGWMPPADFGMRLPPGVRSALVSALSAGQTPLSIVHASSSLKAGRYTLDWKTGGGRSLVQQQAFWAISELLVCEVFLRAEDGDVPGALDSLRRVLELIRSLDGESRLGFAQMKATALVRAMHALQWLLSHHALPDSELESLHAGIEEARARTSLRPALLGLSCMVLEFHQAAPGPVRMVGPGAPKLIDMIRFQLRYQVRAWFGANDRDVIGLLDAILEFAGSTEMAWPERFQRARKLDARTPGNSPMGQAHGTFSAQFVFDHVICPHAEFEARCRLALTALAIERFRNGHGGRLPASLEELTQETQLEMAVDPFDGRSLRYQKLPKGYRLHSVGADGVDNDGVSTMQNSWYGGPPLSGTDISFSVER